jgi:hypothetical protein
VVDLFFERAVCEVGAEELEEVSNAGTGEGCDCSAVWGVEGGSVVEVGVDVCGGCDGRDHVEVMTHGVVVECG